MRTPRCIASIREFFALIFGLTIIKSKLPENPVNIMIAGRIDWPLVDGTKCSPDIPLNICRQWRANYALFRQLLVSAAEEEHLDSTSLAKVLPELDLKK